MKISPYKNRKSNDCQNFPNVKLKHPYSLNKYNPHCQALEMRRICSAFKDYHSYSRKIIGKFVDKGYKKQVVIQQTQKVNQLDKKQVLLQQKTS